MLVQQLQQLIIAVNAGTAATTANLNVTNLHTQPNTLLYGTAEVEWSGEGKQLSITIPPRTGCILGLRG